MSSSSEKAKTEEEVTERRFWWLQVLLRAGLRFLPTPPSLCSPTRHRLLSFSPRRLLPPPLGTFSLFLCPFCLRFLSLSMSALSLHKCVEARVACGKDTERTKKTRYPALPTSESHLLASLPRVCVCV